MAAPDLPGAARPAAAVGARFFDLTALYSVLVAAALAAAAVLALLRLVGVSRWNSRPG